MNDPLKPTLREGLQQNRQFIFWMVLLAIPVACGFYFIGELQKIEATTELATVVSFGERPFEDGPRPLMNVVLASGDTRTIIIPTRVIRYCKMGDKVLLLRRGLELRVAPEACNLAGTTL